MIFFSYNRIYDLLCFIMFIMSLTIYFSYIINSNKKEIAQESYVVAVRPDTHKK